MQGQRLRRPAPSRPPARSARAAASFATSRASSRSPAPAASAAAAGSIISKPCTECRGSGRIPKERKITVRIPAGIATGQRLRLSGEGEAGPSGGPAGDLYVVIHVQDHPFFQREGNDLFCEIPLHYPTLALGGDIKIPTLEGEEAFTVPESTQSGATFTLRGRGMPDVSGRGRGNLVVRP